MKTLFVFTCVIFLISNHANAQVFRWKEGMDRLEITEDLLKDGDDISISFENKDNISVEIFDQSENLPKNGTIAYAKGSGKVQIGSKSIVIPAMYRSQKNLTITIGNKLLIFPISENKADEKPKGEEGVRDKIFFPSYADIAVSDECINCNADLGLAIEYDILRNRIAFPIKKRKNGYKLKMLPVDRIVRVVPVNYNPYVDSMNVSVRFDSKNLESQALFSGFFVPQAKTGTSASTDKGKDTGVGGKESATGDQIRLLQSLHEELTQFWDYVNSLPGMKVEKLESVTTGLVDNINEKFDLHISNGNEFLKQYQENYKPTDEASKQLVIKISAQLNQILNFNRLSILPVQIENSDLSVFTFHTFKRGRKIGDFKYQFFNRGGFKIDFSSGLFTTGLIDHKYVYGGSKSVMDTTRNYLAVWDKDLRKTVLKDSIVGFTRVDQRQVVRVGEGKFNIGLGVLLHAYSRWGRRLNMALSVGGIVDNQTNIRYTGGISALLGSEQRLILTLGVAAGKVSRLGDELTEGEYVRVSSATAEPVMRSQLAASWFLSVTYNLGTILNR